MTATLPAAARIDAAASDSSVAAAVDCFHCGLPVPMGASWHVVIDGASRPMCCPGCAAVAQTIVDNGLTDYYASRSGFAPTADQASLVPPELRLYDDPEAIERFVAQADDAQDCCDAVFSIDGIRCAACVWLIERRLCSVPGVQQANLNVATERLQVRWDRLHCKPSDILKAVRELGYVAYPFDPIRHGEQLQRHGKRLFRQLFIAGLSMMQVMMYAVPAYLAADGTMESDMASLMRWASLWLTVPAVFYSALPFFKGAWSNLKARALGMDVPVALGIAAAFGGSVVATIHGQDEVYFDSVTMFIFLLLCSRYLELVARRKAASALEKLQRALPASAARLTAWPSSRETEIVPAGQLVEGDLLLVRPGEAIAADGVIVEGATAVDLSLLTGESEPVRRSVGESVPGGAVNATQAIVVEVAKPVRESTLSTLVKLIERAGQGKPQLALWADKVAAWFVGALLVFAVAVFGVWHWLDASRAWPIAIAVLVVSCPCALSLAMPSALAAATDRLVRQGVLVVQPHVLETLHRATHVIFDKTGTLTVGKPALRHVETFGAINESWCLLAAAALEATNAHPLGAAIVEAAGRLEGRQAARDVAYTAGQGLEGVVDSIRLRLGRAAFVSGLTHSTITEHDDGNVTAVYLGSEQGVLARFELADAVRGDAREVVDYFKAIGKHVVLLSGDQRSVAQAVAAELGIPAAHGEFLPEQKLEFVRRLQAEGSVVAMVGDGVNDAAVLRAADVSFAMGSGAALAQSHADTVLLSGRLSSVREAAQTAARTMKVIRQNLAWATLYNALAIPAAALGLLTPWLSGIGMSLSSALVVVNALRLRRGAGGEQGARAAQARQRSA
ncbi:heavy metal translocating P-type ATPase [Noviherbaspirillum sp. UKPF54]|uniref:heavy metal translocating P-type ATPase n=1 Tax=Noviherbaspirillum sp. UKPF54 TaxID=2601898 RepID=UPI0011B11A57|nr:heavy metal translocating P-type ATPase [Noviherbaspirillum sp. UKPF54]QDZ27987.1 cadmium-translocating P-type ATPase [Noviherbaspirillum sp. UKPF54]